MNFRKESLEQNFYECNQHKKRILDAKEQLKDIMPLSIESYVSIDKIHMSFLDQMIFRFSKLQDTMGEKIFSKTLELLEEEVKKKSFIDKLNRLEELELINVNQWIFLRKVRNEIAHEYSSNQDEVIESINAIHQESKTLIYIYDVFYEYCKNKFKIN